MIKCSNCGKNTSGKTTFWLVKDNLPFCSVKCLISYVDKLNKLQEVKQMTNLKESATAYIPQKMKNISELPSVDISLELKDGEGIGDDGKPFKYKFFEIDEEKYRVPATVLGQLKDILEAKPDTKTIKVKKSGQGKEGTRYTTIQLT